MQADKKERKKERKKGKEGTASKPINQIVPRVAMLRKVSFRECKSFTQK
jgi:hypothetical protein